MEIWQKVKVEYRARKTHTRYRVLELSMLSTGSGGYPQLKGKAHAIKHLGFILRDLFHAMSDTTDAIHMAILAALDSLCRLEEILLKWNFPCSSRIIRLRSFYAPLPIWCQMCTDGSSCVL